MVCHHQPYPLHTLMTNVRNPAGHVAFFGFIAELKQPKDFPKSLALMQTLAVSFYMLISTIIYYYAGPSVASPALGSASPIVRKIAFGIALPTIVVAGVVNGSVACKYIYMRIWKGTDVIHQNSFKSIGSWVAICAALWTASFVIAEAIPNFNLLLGLVVRHSFFTYPPLLSHLLRPASLLRQDAIILIEQQAALFASWFSYGLPGFLWLYMNKKMLFTTKRKIALTILNTGIFLLGATIVSL
jgi:hypothetical protein